MNKRVVVTGMGVISPLGLDVPSTWQGLIAGKSGVDYISLFDASDFEVKIAAEVKNINSLQFIDRKRVRAMSMTWFIRCHLPGKEDRHVDVLGW